MSDTVRRRCEGRRIPVGLPLASWAGGLLV